MAFAFGSIIGPILGGALEDWNGYDFAVDIMVVIAASFAVLYFIVALGCHCCQKKQDN